MIRLLVCISGVYSMFLIWAIAQERLSVDKFRSPLLMGTCQSVVSAITAFVYLLLKRESLVLSKPLMLSYVSVTVSITFSSPFGFASLNHISYPTMVLAKSCKLIPVIIMNVLIYRRKFKLYKYVVVSLVTTGIFLFMHFGQENKSSSNSSLLGIFLLLINLTLDGLTNSTQDDIFASNPSLSGQQMMLFINLFSSLLSLCLSILPIPYYIPILHPSHQHASELSITLDFIKQNPSIIPPLFQFALTGALGQLFIFETLQHFGSLTLVTITLTRKLLTMLLSVFIYNHKLFPGQWFGASVVFAGISLEAWVKRKDIHAKQVIQEKEKAKLKSL